MGQSQRNCQDVVHGHRLHTCAATTTSDDAAATTTSDDAASASTPGSEPQPGSVFAGQVPGKFYLGMSCGVICPDKESGPRTVLRRPPHVQAVEQLERCRQGDPGRPRAGRLPWVSFKPPQAGAAGWSAIASGSYDTDLKALATTLKANDDKPVSITFHHEPSNDGDRG